MQMQIREISLFFLFFFFYVFFFRVLMYMAHVFLMEHIICTAPPQYTGPTHVKGVLMPISCRWSALIKPPLVIL
jgi:hypothetical protein